MYLAHGPYIMQVLEVLCLTMEHIAAQGLHLQLQALCCEPLQDSAANPLPMTAALPASLATTGDAYDGATHSTASSHGVAALAEAKAAAVIADLRPHAVRLRNAICSTLEWAFLPTGPILHLLPAGKRGPLLDAWVALHVSDASTKSSEDSRAPGHTEVVKHLQHGRVPARYSADCMRDNLAVCGHRQKSRPPDVEEVRCCSSTVKLHNAIPPLVFIFTSA